LRSHAIIAFLSDNKSCYFYFCKIYFIKYIYIFYIFYPFDISDIEAGVNCLKNGKACGYYGISRDIVYSHPALIVHLKLLFNLICEHGFVPDNF